ncbi:MAG: endonuclease III [Acidimicrobiales bacterium]
MARPRTAKGRARVTAERLADEYPGDERALCALQHRNPFELLTATILSAQSTDEMVNRVTPELFRRWPTPAELAAAPVEEVEDVVHATGFFRQKARSIQGMAAALGDDYDGEVPRSMADLVKLPGVGRKTANVVRSVAFGLPGLPVDTHVGRLSRRLELVDTEDPVKAEAALNELVPAKFRGLFSLRLILHGRQVCTARRPQCESCVLQDFCPSASIGSGG